MTSNQSDKIVVENKNDKDLLEQNKKDLQDFFGLKSKRTQMTLSLSALAIMLFILSSYTLPFKSNLFRTIYPKSASQAQSLSGTFLYLQPNSPLAVGQTSTIQLNLILDHQPISDFTTDFKYDAGTLNVTQIEVINANNVTLDSQKIDRKNGQISIAGSIKNLNINQKIMPLVLITLVPQHTGQTFFSFEDPTLINKPDYTNLNSQADDLVLEVLEK